MAAWHRVNFLYDKLLCRLQRLIRWGFSDNVFQIWSRYSLLEWRVVPPSATSSHIWAKQTRNKVRNKFYCKKQSLKMATFSRTICVKGNSFSSIGEGFCVKKLTSRAQNSALFSIPTTPTDKISYLHAKIPYPWEPFLPWCPCRGEWRVNW